MREPSDVEQIETVNSSKSLERGILRKPGSLHLHVDAGSDEALLTSLVTELQRRGLTVKKSCVARSVRGVQADDADLRDTYTSHTPRRLEAGSEEVFLSLALGDREHAVAMLGELLPRLQLHGGVVIEAERVSAYYHDRHWDLARPARIEGIMDAEVGFIGEPTLDFEMHHCIEIPVDGSGDAQLELDRLNSQTEAKGLHVGTWAEFVKPNVLAFHSTVFGKTFSRLRDQAADDCDVLSRTVLNQFTNSKLWVLIEQILGVWQPPLQTFTLGRASRVSVPELVGTTDTGSLNLLSVVTECREASTEGEGISESRADVRSDICENVRALQEVVQSSDYDPLLIELAVLDQPFGDTSLPSVTRAFASDIVSFVDTPDAPLMLDAWHNAINRILDNSVNPIVVHPETYASGYLYETLDWLMQDYYRLTQTPQKSLTWEKSEWPERVESFEMSLMKRRVHVRGGGTLLSTDPAAFRRPYPVGIVGSDAPVQRTLTRLGAGLVFHLMNRWAEVEEHSSRWKHLQRVLLALSRSQLVIVPFRRPAHRGLEQERPHGELPAGCVFLLLHPKDHAVRSPRALDELALRIHWVMFWAVLESYSTSGSSAGLDMSELGPRRQMLISAVEAAYRRSANERDLASLSTDLGWMKEPWKLKLQNGIRDN